MIEGGARVLGSAFDDALVHEVWAFVAPVIVGGGQPAVAGRGPALIQDAWRLSDLATEALGPDLLVRGLTNIQHAEDACSLAS